MLYNHFRVVIEVRYFTIAYIILFGGIRNLDPCYITTCNIAMSRLLNVIEQ